MRLIRFGEGKPGVEIDGERLDCSGHFEDWNREFFLKDGMASLSALMNDDKSVFPKVASSEAWCSPVARPGMILCVGLNYEDHARESNMDIPSEPVLFMKAANTLSGPFDNVEYPKRGSKLDWEVELGIVLAKDVLYLDNEQEGAEAIAGYTIVHDLSERAFQLESTGQWVKGKSCPGFSPVGPYLVTKDEISNVLDLKMQLSVNGELKQNGSTKTMIFSPGYLVYYISQYMKLEAGDIISTGTPPGVGLGMSPPQYLSAGDIVELTIEGLGSQKQEII